MNERLARVVREEHALVWRMLRRLGVSTDSVPDATQQVFLVLCRRIDDVEPGRERSFLVGTAARVASEFRRSRSRQREVLEESLEERERPSVPDTAALLQMRRDRELLDALLDELPDSHRAVFVLYELEEHTMASIAEMLNLPAGTVASRLRRAREVFMQRARIRLGLGEPPRQEKQP